MKLTDETPAKNDDMIKEYLNDDCFNVFPTIADNSAHLIFTGVPDSNNLGLDDDIEKYKKFINEAFIQFNRIIKDDGFVALCQSDRKMGGQVFSKHSFIIGLMCNMGFVLKDYKIIVKNSIDSKDLYIFPYQHLCVFTRTGKIARKGDWLKGILVYDMKMKESKKNKTGSFFSWNPEFVKLVIGTLTKENDLVIDPFSGTGIVPMTAYQLNRQHIGIEMDKSMYNNSVYSPGLPI